MCVCTVSANVCFCPVFLYIIHSGMLFFSFYPIMSSHSCMPGVPRSLWDSLQYHMQIKLLDVHDNHWVLFGQSFPCHPFLLQYQPTVHNEHNHNTYTVLWYCNISQLPNEHNQCLSCHASMNDTMCGYCAVVLQYQCTMNTITVWLYSVLYSTATFVFTMNTITGTYATVLV